MKHYLSKLFLWVVFVSPVYASDEYTDTSPMPFYGVTIGETSRDKLLTDYMRLIKKSLIAGKNEHTEANPPSVVEGVLRDDKTEIVCFTYHTYRYRGSTRVEDCFIMKDNIVVGMLKHLNQHACLSPCKVTSHRIASDILKQYKFKAVKHIDIENGSISIYDRKNQRAIIRRWVGNSIKRSRYNALTRKNDYDYHFTIIASLCLYPKSMESAIPIINESINYCSTR